MIPGRSHYYEIIDKKERKPVSEFIDKTQTKPGVEFDHKDEKIENTTTKKSMTNHIQTLTSSNYLAE